MLSKDILFWSTMGSSQTYNVFMGLIEVIPGLLLFHRKTRMLGSFIAIGVFTNVFFLNIGFDITVKLLSFVLLVSSMVVFAPYFSIFRKAFFGKETTENEFKIVQSDSKLWFGIKVVALLLIAFEITSPYISLNSAKNEHSASLTGSYEVISIQGHSNLINLSETRRIHLHSKGYLITEKNNGAMKDYPFRFDPIKKKIGMNGLQISVTHSKNKTTFRWFENNQEIEIVTKQIDLDRLPLRQDNWHWTVEEMLESTD
eukprot:Opistho-1_new@76771